MCIFPCAVKGSIGMVGDMLFGDGRAGDLLCLLDDDVQ